MAGWPIPDLGDCEVDKVGTVESIRHSYGRDRPARLTGQVPGNVAILHSLA